MWGKDESPDVSLYIGGYAKSEYPYAFFSTIMKYNMLSPETPSRTATLETSTFEYAMTYTCMAAVGNTFIAARYNKPDGWTAIDRYVYTDPFPVLDNYSSYEIMYPTIEDKLPLLPIAMECHPPSIDRRRLADAVFDQNECQVLYEVDYGK